MSRGGARVGAGRPRKTKEAIHLDGIPSKAVTKPVWQPDKIEADLGLLDEYFAQAMKEGGTAIPTAEQLRAEMLTYIKANGAEGLIAPQLLSDYVINRQGFLACEYMNRKVGRLTSQMKLSPYVTAAATYRRAMQEDFNQISLAITRFGKQPAEEPNAFLQLMANRGF